MAERRFRLPPPPPPPSLSPSGGDAGFLLDSELEGGATSSRAGGRLGPTSATYEDARDDFVGRGSDEVAAGDRPPYEWSATAEEVEEIRRWTERRIARQHELERDPLRKFLVSYAACRGMEVSRLSGSHGRSSAYRREMADSGPWMEVDVLQRPQTGAPGARAFTPSPAATPGAPGFGRPPLPPPRPFSRPREVFPAEQPPRIPRPRESFSWPRPPSPVPPGGGDGDDPTSIARVAERARLARISGWLERPEITGEEGLSAEVWGNVEYAFTALKQRLPRQFGRVPRAEVLANSECDDVRGLFARIAATSAKITTAQVGPVTTLDRTWARLRQELAELHHMIRRWSYDPATGSFLAADGDGDGDAALYDRSPIPYSCRAGARLPTAASRLWD
jgi:hypothetical protein